MDDAFGVCALHDYFAWNHARWAAYERLANEYGATPEQVDGGYEFNGWLTRDAYIKSFGVDGSARPGWWVIDNRYAIDFAPRPGYRTLDTVPYDAWLGSSDSALLIQERDRKS